MLKVKISYLVSLNKKFAYRILWFVLSLVLLSNAIAFMHAYKFTHFTRAETARTNNELSVSEKLKVIFTGVNNPRPLNKQLPLHPYRTIYIKSNKKLECWFLDADSARGTVILFHGYGGNKSLMLDKADEFLKMGYNTMLVDFMGSGGSEGNTTTIGFKEAAEVQDCYEYLVRNHFQNISLFGTSMGSVAVMKAVKDYNLQPASIIIECPFGSMYQTVCARFKMLGIPSFPMAGLLVFWGGVQNGFWAFSHNPEAYAKSIHCPTLLLYGEKDEKVSRREIDAIFKNLQGKKHLETYPLAGHENYLKLYGNKWVSDVKSFLDNTH
jgi:alpha-beta hydrolase superfamily lysophospholipase